MQNPKKGEKNKELRARDLNRVAGGKQATTVKCPRCGRIYILTCCDDRSCPYCGIFGR